MTESLVTLTTDFGQGSSYVAALKGVLLGVNSQARLVDLAHNIPAQDLRYTAFFLRTAVPYFPPATLHVVVVDPGVGTARAILYVEVAGQRLLVPDNGCWTTLAADRDPERVIRLTEPRYWRPEVSATFHGRDIFAPSAGHLSLGLDPCLLGPAVTDWVRLELPVPALDGEALLGEVVFIDHFGNLLTNIPAEALSRWGGKSVTVKVGMETVTRRVRTYGEVEPGTLVALVSSMGTLEVAVSHGDAAARLHAAVGTPVEVRPATNPSAPSA
jgi:S-adenosylmethionine hydrolase